MAYLFVKLKPKKDFVFAKEVRLGTYSNKVAPPPAALVATQLMTKDPRAEPKYGERVPYVVVNGGPQSRLVDLVFFFPLPLFYPGIFSDLIFFALTRLYRHES